MLETKQEEDILQTTSVLEKKYNRDYFKRLQTIVFLVVVSLLPLLLLPALYFTGGVMLMASFLLGGVSLLGLLLGPVAISALIIASMRLSKLSYRFYKNYENDIESFSFSEVFRLFFRFIEPDMKWQGVYIRLSMIPLFIILLNFSVILEEMDSVSGIIHLIAILLIVTSILTPFFEIGRRHKSLMSLIFFIGIILVIFL